MGNALRIVVADDHPVVLFGERAILQRAGETVSIVGEAANADELLGLLRTQACDLLITDFSMPHPGSHTDDGLPLLKLIRREFPPLRIIVLTMVSNPALWRAMLATGVHGLLDKASAMTELMLAVQAVGGGRRYVGGTLKLGLERPGSATGKAVPWTLSAREAEVVRLFVQGLSVTQIAESLHRSVKTISRQKSDAMHKLGIENHSQLYACARELGLLT